MPQTCRLRLLPFSECLTLDLTILMPCLNEAETLAICVRQAVQAIRDNGVRGEVVVADNGSTDGSQDIAIAEGARVVDVPVRGYGAALIAGIEAARGKYVIMADADASYHFEHLPRFLPKLSEGYDLVMGNRFAGGIEPGAMPPLHQYLGNPVLSAIGRIFFSHPRARLPLRPAGLPPRLHPRAQPAHHRHGVRLRDGRQVLARRPAHGRSADDALAGRPLPRRRISAPGATAGATCASCCSTARAGCSSIPASRCCSSASSSRAACCPVRSPHFAGGHTLDVDTLTYALGLVLIGTHITFFAVVAKVFGTQAGFLPPNPKFERLFKHITLETGLLFGAFCC